MSLTLARAMAPKQSPIMSNSLWIVPPSCRLSHYIMMTSSDSLFPVLWYGEVPGPRDVVTSQITDY